MRMQPHWLPNTSIDRCNHHSFAGSQKPGNVSRFIPDDGPSHWSGCCCYAKLRVLKEAKPFVPHKIFMSLIVQLIISKLDYCNSILVSASCRNLNTLQAVMNTAARLIYGRRSCDHITPLLMDLHWLRIQNRISYYALLDSYEIVSFNSIDSSATVVSPPRNGTKCHSHYNLQIDFNKRWMIKLECP